MKKYFFFLFLSFPLFSEVFDESPKNISVGLHLAEAVVGNYGLSLAFRLNSHLELSLPIEWYSFSHSLPGLLARTVANNFAIEKGVKEITQLSMFHLKAGLGLRWFPGQSALASGFYLEPILYAGVLRHSDFEGVEFDDRREALQALVKTVFQKRPMKDNFAMSPQINIGYQWISQAGFLCQLALYGNYVYAPSANTIFDASDRFFASSPGSVAKKMAWVQPAIDGYRAIGTQINGWHAGLSINLGFAF